MLITSVENTNSLRYNNYMTKKSNVSETASAFGRLGGKSTFKKRGKSYMREIGKRGAEKRWSKIKNNKKQNEPTKSK